MRNVNVVIDKQVKLKKALRINDRILLYKDKMDNRSLSPSPFAFRSIDYVSSYLANLSEKI